MNKFQIATAIYYGTDSLSYLSGHANQSVLVVTDSFMATTNVMKQIVTLLQNARVTVFDRVLPNPSVEVVADAYGAFLTASPIVLIGLGGGSSIDTAKAVRKIAVEQGRPHVEFIAIPTTSGSGSEMTSYAVITDEAANRKIAMLSSDMYPDVAILDPEAVRTTPPNLTADAGMDAVSHAVEAYVALGHSDCSDAMAEKALHLLFEFLPRCFIDGNDMEARERVHNAATLAGMAFENAGLGIVHSLSHAIGGTFAVPHGRLNALIMPWVIEFNAGDLPLAGAAGPVAVRYARLGRVLGATRPTARNRVLGLVNMITQLRRDLKMPSTIVEAGVDPDAFSAAIPELARTALGDRCTPPNPRSVTVSDLEGLLKNLL